MSGRAVYRVSSSLEAYRWSPMTAPTHRRVLPLATTRKGRRTLPRKEGFFARVQRQNPARSTGESAPTSSMRKPRARLPKAPFQAPLLPGRGRLAAGVRKPLGEGSERPSNPLLRAPQSASSGAPFNVYFQPPIGYLLGVERGLETVVSEPQMTCSQVVENPGRTRGNLGEIRGFINGPPPTLSPLSSSLGITVRNSTLLPEFSTQISNKPTTSSPFLIPSVTEVSATLHRVVHKITVPLLRRLVFNSSFKERTVSSP